MSAKPIIAAALSITLLAGCTPPSQNRYNARDVGVSSILKFGTVITAREVEVTGENSGLGAAAGMTAGAGAGSMIGSGDGSLAGLLAGNKLKYERVGEGQYRIRKQNTA